MYEFSQLGRRHKWPGNLKLCTPQTSGQCSATRRRPLSDLVRWQKNAIAALEDYHDCIPVT